MEGRDEDAFRIADELRRRGHHIGLDVERDNLFIDNRLTGESNA